MPVLQPAEPWRKTGRLRDRGAVQADRPQGLGARARDDPRGGRHLPRRAGRALLPRPAADPLPLPGQGARRAAPARRRAAHARVHHEGLLHLRPRPGGPGGALRAARRRLRPHHGAHRPALLPRRGRRRHDGRPRRARVHGAVRGRRGRGRARRRATRRTSRSRCSSPDVREDRRRLHARTVSALTIEPAIEVGNIFKLGTRYSEPLGASYLDENGGEHADLDGLLRDRPGAHRRRGGRAVRRRARHLLAARARAVRRAPGRARQARHARARGRRRSVYEHAREGGVEVLYDDRDARPRREVRRRRAARLPAAADRRAARRWSPARSRCRCAAAAQAAPGLPLEGEPRRSSLRAVDELWRSLP